MCSDAHSITLTTLFLFIVFIEKTRIMLELAIFNTTLSIKINIACSKNDWGARKVKERRYYSNGAEYLKKERKMHIEKDVV